MRRRRYRERNLEICFEAGFETSSIYAAAFTEGRRIKLGIVDQSFAYIIDRRHFYSSDQELLRNFNRGLLGAEFDRPVSRVLEYAEELHDAFSEVCQRSCED
jgi:hypothetical protein